MLHRDIKPKNILMVGNGTMYPSFKLHDFDYALIYLKAKACRQAFCGTYEWQPPEDPVINTSAAKIWAVGAVLRFLVCDSNVRGSHETIC
jgi:serine/threonine protein kinase